MNWIPEEVVCIKSHEQGVVKKGNVYPVLSVRKEKCACGAIVFDVGVVDPDATGRMGYPQFCATCGKIDNPVDGVWWINSILFTPLLTQSQEADLAEAIEETMCEPVEYRLCINYATKESKLIPYIPR